jgi:thiol-disulfide isomerase/thioredoxin
MKQFILLFIIVMGLFGCSSEAKKDEPLRLVAQRNYLQTFDWSAYYFKQGSKKLNPSTIKYDLVGNAEHRLDDSTLWIMPLDTSQILIELEEGERRKKYFIRAKANHLIDSSWYDVPVGQFPTPLNSNSWKAWSNFSQYRTLGRSVPEFNHYDYLTSDTITSNIFKGKTTLLNFWYRGCAPCMAEMPALKALREEWKNEPDLQFISVCLDSVYQKGDELFVGSDRIHSSTQIPDYQIDNGFRQIGQGQTIADSFFVRAYPTNLIIDQNGKVSKVLVGANPDDSNDELQNNLSRELIRIHRKTKLDAEMNSGSLSITD